MNCTTLEDCVHVLTGGVLYPYRRGPHVQCISLQDEGCPWFNWGECGPILVVGGRGEMKYDHNIVIVSKGRRTDIQQEGAGVIVPLPCRWVLWYQNEKRCLFTLPDWTNPFSPLSCHKSCLCIAQGIIFGQRRNYLSPYNFPLHRKCCRFTHPLPNHLLFEVWLWEECAE